MEGDRFVSVGRIQHGWLRVERHICAQAKLPLTIVQQIAYPAEGICANAIGRVTRHIWEQFVFVHQFYARVSIIPPQEIESGFEQVTV